VLRAELLCGVFRKAVRNAWDNWIIRSMVLILVIRLMTCVIGAHQSPFGRIVIDPKNVRWIFYFVTSVMFPSEFRSGIFQNMMSLKFIFHVIQGEYSYIISYSKAISHFILFL